MKKVNMLALIAVFYTLSFVAIEWLGVFSADKPPFRGILMFWVVLVSSLVSLALIIVSAWVSRSSMVPAHWLGVIGTVLIVAGIWTSRLTDFGINLVLTEGQVYQTDEHRSMGLLYAGMISPVSQFRLVLKEVVLDAGGSTAKPRAQGRLLMYQPGGKPPDEIMLSQGKSRFQNGMSMKVKSFGYSLRYAIRKSGKILDSDFISLRLYPYGNEDYFRLLTPHTFSVRYYPGHQEEGVERPLKVKIARNKDIIFNEYTALNEVLRFEDAEISFEEMRKWVEISISRRWGEIIAWAGLGLGFISAAMLVIRRLKDRAPL